MRRETDLAALAWPVGRLGEALSVLARRRGLAPGKLDLAEPRESASPEDLDRWIGAAVAAMGLEAEPVEAPYGEVENLLRRSAPALLRLPGAGSPRFLPLLGVGRNAARVLDPEHQVRRVPLAQLRDALRGDHDARLGPEVDRLLAEAEVPARRRPRARAALLAERLAGARIGGCWLLDLPPGASPWAAARRAGLPGRAAVLVLSHMVQHTLLLLSWWVLGLGVLRGRLDPGWLIAWALLQLSFIPFRSLELWSAGVLTTRAGRLFKRRLMTGALKIEPEEIRHQGAGQLLGRVLEAEAVEALALSGGLLGLMAGMELLIAAAVLHAGAGGGSHALLLLAWLVLALFLGWLYWRQRRHWTGERLTLTHDLVEGLVGHRTRLAQEGRERWHDGEDHRLNRALVLAGAMDRSTALLMAVAARG